MPGLPWGSLANEVQRLGSNEYIEVRRALSRLAQSGVNGDARGTGWPGWWLRIHALNLDQRDRLASGLAVGPQSFAPGQRLAGAGAQVG